MSPEQREEVAALLEEHSAEELAEMLVAAWHAVPRYPGLDMQDVWNACMEDNATLLTTWAALLHVAGVKKGNKWDAKRYDELLARGRAMRQPVPA